MIYCGGVVGWDVMGGERLCCHVCFLGLGGGPASV